MQEQVQVKMQEQLEAQVEVRGTGGGGVAAHHLHLRLAQHPAPTGRQLGLWNKPALPLIMLQNPNDPTLKCSSWLRTLRFN